MDKELIVCVTGAAGQIAYSFIPQMLRGNAFPNVGIHLRMLDIEVAQKVLEGVAMELQDCNYSLLLSVEYGTDPEKMFKDADVIVFLGGFPRKPGMERKDLLQKNKQIFIEQSKALSVAKQNVKCVVVANPANTNAKILAQYSKIDKKNITCLSRLDHNRAVGQIATKAQVKGDDVEGVMIFGNHSLTQYPCIMHLKVKGKPVKEIIEKEWLKETFIPKVQKRGGEILGIKGSSSVFSAANAVIDHLRDWYVGTDKIVSMGVISNGDYGIPAGLWTSLPVKCKNFDYQVITDFQLCEFCRSQISITVKELEEESKDAQLS